MVRINEIMGKMILADMGRSLRKRYGSTPFYFGIDYSFQMSCLPLAVRNVDDFATVVL